MIFCRMNGGNTENNWGNKWNQTNDLPKATGTYCTITNGGGGDIKASCNWNHTPFEICISGPDVAFADEPLILEAKCPGATYFQWYKGGTADANKIEGATSATYRKAKCAFEDAGTYYCKAGGSESAVKTSSGKDVKMYRAYFNNGRYGGEYGYVDIKHNTDPANHKAAGMIFLGESWDYAFSITDGFNHWYGNNNDESHKMQNGNSTNWNFTLDQDKCWLFEQAGKQKTLRDAGLWYATMDEEELQEMMERDHILRRDWDPVYGDRMQKIVFIGQHLDKEGIAALMDSCLA